MLPCLGPPLALQHLGGLEMPRRRVRDRHRKTIKGLDWREILAIGAQDLPGIRQVEVQRLAQERQRLLATLTAEGEWLRPIRGPAQEQVAESVLAARIERRQGRQVVIEH